MAWNNIGRKNNDRRPKCAEMKELTRADINPLLFDLLTAGCPHPHEEPVRMLIKAAVKRAGLNVNDGSTEFLKDDFGNLWVDTRSAKEHRTMFSSHMDIVSKEPNILSLYMIKEGPREGMIYGAYKRKGYAFYDIKDQTKVIDLKEVLSAEKITKYKLNVTKTKSKDGKLSKAWIIDTNKENLRTNLSFWAKHVDNTIYPSTLGADDKVGVYIMLRMIAAKIPGLYVFHVGEERGGLGSKYIFENYKDALKDLDACIAFDRADYGDIIAKQRPGRTASISYTNDLATLLNEHMPPMQKFKGDIQGSFTDSASYMDIIPECTNLSVGYFDQHGPEEHMDYVWLDSILLPAVLKLDWSKVKPVRDPKPYVAPYRQQQHIGFYGRGRTTADDDKSWFIDFKDVKKDTPFHKIPEWKPEDGFLEGVTADGMKRIVESYCVDLYAIQERTNAFHKLLLSLKDVTDHYVALRKYVIANGGIIEDADFAEVDLNDDPNGHFGEENKVVFLKPNTTIPLCKRCLREPEECVCMPVRAEYKTEGEYNYAVAMWTNSKKPIINMRPDRLNYKDQASFEADLQAYLEGLDIKADVLLGKTKNIVEILADPEVKERLEK